jgi:hypothetical protein
MDPKPEESKCVIFEDCHHTPHILSHTSIGVGVGYDRIGYDNHLVDDCYMQILTARLRPLRAVKDFFHASWSPLQQSYLQ